MTKTRDLADLGGGFIQAGSGAVQRTVESKLQDTVSVKDFGVVGNGEITINVPADYATINAALASISGKSLTAGTTYKIKVADGTYSLTSSILITHPNGDQIKIIGNETTPSNCIITVSGLPVFDALVVANGGKLGYLNGFRFNLASKATSANNYTAVLAVAGSWISCGPDIEVNNWYYGIAAREGSFIYCPGVSVDNAGDVGIWAYNGSTIYCRNATSNNASDAASSLGFGIQAEYGSSIDCSDATASGCKIGGIASLSGSSVKAYGATASNNVGSGFFARDNSVIIRHNSTASNNTRFGAERIDGAVIEGSPVTASGNGLGAANDVAYLNDDGTLGARISAGIGPLRVDASGAHPVYFNTSGGLQFEVSHAASATSHLATYGSSIDQPGLRASGSATDISLNLQSQGVSPIYLGSNRTNFIAAQGGNTGVPPEIRAEGGDANIDLFLNPKGTGQVRWGVHSAGSVTTNGYVEWKLADGATVRVAAQRI